MSHTHTLNLVSLLGNNFDSPILHWMENVQWSITLSQVINNHHYCVLSYKVYVCSQGESSPSQTSVNSPPVPSYPMCPPIHASTPVTFEGPASSDTEESHLSPDGESEGTTEQLLKVSICKNSTALPFYPLLTGTSLSLLNENETTLSIEPNATDACPEVKSMNAGYKLVFEHSHSVLKFCTP